LTDITISNDNDDKDVPIHYLKVGLKRKSSWVCSYYKQALEEDNLIEPDLAIDLKHDITELIRYWKYIHLRFSQKVQDLESNSNNNDTAMTVTATYI
jgi:hypothetical protein